MTSFNWTYSSVDESTSSMNSSAPGQDSCYSQPLILIVKIQSISLLIFGFLANLCSFVVLIRPRLRRRPTFSYLAFLSLSNALLSLINATFSILGVYFGLTLENLPLFIFCRLLSRFSIDFLTHFSFYTLTAVDIDRIRTVTSKIAGQHRYSRSSGGKQHGCARAFIQVCFVELFLAAILFVIDSHWLMFYGYDSYDPNTFETKPMCTIPSLNLTANPTFYAIAYNKYLTSILPLVEVILSTVVPCSISVIATFIILRHVSVKYTLLSHINKRLKKSRRRMELHLSILLISLNCVFILLTTPHAIYTVYLGQLQNRLNSKNESEGDVCTVSVTQKCLDLLQQCYCMSTFFLYILTNKRFREEFYELIRRNLFLSCIDEKSNHSSTHLPSHHRRHHNHHRYLRHNETVDPKADHLMPPSHSMLQMRLSLSDYLSQDECDDDDERASSSKGYDTSVVRLSVNRSSLY
ncbi:unnamed protein product [Adineta ricciae]|uniref:G-protein coupled receptors family 1 profile domain-containing protein n=1 Tax=Adineta ricciae TaxID=249248 RepID=A0A814F2E8_ADIRI|nr:unnamed protein product [Adineta ricciae]CAF0977207.1 unnamed protein product [Adineta ricciae]